MKRPYTVRQFLADERQRQFTRLVNTHVEQVCATAYRVYWREADTHEITRAAESWAQTYPHRDATREQAAVHEAGHFIAYEVEGMMASAAEISGRGRCWRGQASARKEPSIGPMSATSTNLRSVARVTLAGAFAEALMMGGDAFSSMGELMEARLLVAQAAAVEQHDDDAMWRLTLVDTALLVEGFQFEIRACAELLVSRKKICWQQRATRRILDQVGRGVDAGDLSRNAAALVDRVITANVPRFTAGPA